MAYGAGGNTAPNSIANPTLHKSGLLIDAKSKSLPFLSAMLGKRTYFQKDGKPYVDFQRVQKQLGPNIEILVDADVSSNGEILTKRSGEIATRTAAAYNGPLSATFGWVLYRDENSISYSDLQAAMSDEVKIKKLKATGYGALTEKFLRTLSTAILGGSGSTSLPSATQIGGLAAWVSDGVTASTISQTAYDAVGFTRSDSANTFWRSTVTECGGTLSLTQLSTGKVAVGTTQDAMPRLVVAENSVYITTKIAVQSVVNITDNNPLELGGDYVMYDNMAIIPDPDCLADHAFMLDMSTFSLYLREDGDMGQYKEDPILKAGETAVMLQNVQFVCDNPRKNLKFINVR
jgi:hypothetical protein